eukprot:CAMPEP_0172435500 /NCGR_PEP_ID=MMETSP1064-20121228/71211_1 /TAXON_ID=202472 /ORGANISM="Aulacoseira subarctica , Strain CCAP 1002/5" /LENGTH=391 /DNA_ID=CAMNT_0013183821 /DNA_START=46 /DNA_END=1221 /DNA_ORIENTATION=+
MSKLNFRRFSESRATSSPPNDESENLRQRVMGELTGILPAKLSAMQKELLEVRELRGTNLLLNKENEELCNDMQDSIAENGDLVTSNEDMSKVIHSQQQVIHQLEAELEYCLQDQNDACDYEQKQEDKQFQFKFKLRAAAVEREQLANANQQLQQERDEMLDAIRFLVQENNTLKEQLGGTSHDGTQRCEMLDAIRFLVQENNTLKEQLGGTSHDGTQRCGPSASFSPHMFMKFNERRKSEKYVDKDRRRLWFNAQTSSEMDQHRRLLPPILSELKNLRVGALRRWPSNRSSDSANNSFRNTMDASQHVDENVRNSDSSSPSDSKNDLLEDFGTPSRSNSGRNIHSNSTNCGEVLLEDFGKQASFHSINIDTEEPLDGDNDLLEGFGSRAG